MRRLFGLLVFLAIVVVAVGLWRHWFTIDVNKKQIDHDTAKIERKLEHGTEKLREDVNSGAKKVEEKTSN